MTTPAQSADPDTRAQADGAASTAPAAARELSVAQAVGHLCEAAEPVAGLEDVPLAQAAGRILACDLACSIDLPRFDNAAMDGYALRHADLAGGAPLRELGRSLAGRGFDGEVCTGGCVRIMTGAPLPPGADTVVVLEDLAAGDGLVRVRVAPAPGANIRRRAEHLARGAVALRSGTRLSGAALGLAAAAGCATVCVRRRLRVGLLSTGDELADPPQPLSSAGSYDANRPLLQAACLRLGCEVHDLGICGDRGDEFDRAVERAFAAGCDVLLASGGAAQGDADVVRQAGGVHFLPLNIRPGRGLAHARLQREHRPLWLLGLPGNAVAAYVMFHLVARPLLLHLAGAAAEPLPRLRAPLAQATSVRGGRIDYRRGRIDGEGRVAPTRDQGSAMLRTVVEADCLIELGPAAHYAAGALVDVIPLRLLD